MLSAFLGVLTLFFFNKQREFWLSKALEENGVFLTANLRHLLK